jgi:hypothetical protein
LSLFSIMSVGSADSPFHDDDDASSVVSTGPYVYENPWAAAALDEDDTGVYTNSDGTIRILERTVADLPVLSSSDLIETSGKKTYGLRMILPTRIGDVENFYRTDKQLFSQSTHFRLPFPLRPHDPPGEECDILLNKGSSWDIDVIAPAYAPDASMDSARPFTWNIEGCFHPNWVAWKRQVADDSFRISAGQKRWSTAIAQFFIPVERGLQKLVLPCWSLSTVRMLTCRF